MATLRERLETDYKDAMRSQQRVRIDTLRLIKAAMQRVAIDKRKETLEDQDIIPVLTQQAKQRQETIDAAKQSNRQDILAQSVQELEIITAYLPKALAPEAVNTIIEEAINTVGPNHGQVMKYVMSKAPGAVDGKLVSQLVSQRLKPANA